MFALVFPSVRFHEDGRQVVVNDPAELEALGDGWEDTPAKFGYVETPDPDAPASADDEKSKGGRKKKTN